MAIKTKGLVYVGRPDRADNVLLIYRDGKMKWVKKEVAEAQGLRANKPNIPDCYADGLLI